MIATAPLEVRVLVHNPGAGEVPSLDVVGELGARRRKARLASGLAPGESAAVVLPFDELPPRPGVHALVLLLEHAAPGAPDAAGNPPVASQRAWLLLAIGARPSPAVRMRTQSSVLDVRGTLPVHVESADGEAHRVALVAYPARGLRHEGEAVVVDVPATGVVAASLPLARAGAARGSRQEVLVVAETLDGELARTAVATATVDVAPDPSLVPRLRWPLLGLGLLLLAAAAFAEVRKERH